jgi:hypothetical protein
VRITYDFDDPAELADFEASLYPEEMRAERLAVSTPDEPFRVEDGHAVAAGGATLRSLYDLAPPLTLRLDFEFTQRELSGPNLVAVGALDDGREHFLWSFNLALLQLFAGDRVLTGSMAEDRLYLGQPYALELRSDGRTHVLLADGVEVSTLAAEAAASGALFLLASTHTQLRCARLSIEGRLVPHAFARLIEARIADELDARF